jgi:type IV fimbrial biogenesis protein FimT
MQTDKKMNTDMKPTRGFTLIELMVTLAVATILITVAIPGFRTIIQNNRVAAQSNDLLTALTLARSEALKRGVQVSVCSSDDQTDCDAAPGTDWVNGWIVFVDDNADGNKDGGELLIRVWDGLSGSPSLTGTVNTIEFLPSGLADLAADQTLTLVPYNCTGNQQRTLTITRVGRASISETTCP